MVFRGQDMSHGEKSRDELLREIEELRRRLDEPEETVRAIRQGEVDAFVVSAGDGEKVFTIKQADPPYRRMIEEMNEGAMILALDGTVLYANRCLAEQLGTTPGTLRGESVFPFVAPASRPAFESLLKNDPGGTAPVEVTLRSRDGTEHLVYLAVNRLDLEDVPVMCAVATNLTERKRMEEERARLVACMEHAGEMILVTDASANIQYVNPAFERITGYPREEVLGRNPRILKSGKQDAAFYRTLWGALTDGGVWSGTITNRKKDGTLFSEMATISRVTDPEGKVVNYVAVKRDVTDQLALEARLQRAEKMEAVGRLAAGIAHDFNNLITVVQGTASLVQHRLSADDPAQGDLQVIRHAGQQAVELTRSLLVFSRGKVIEPEDLDLGEIVGELKDLSLRVLPDNILLDVVMDAGPHIVRADKGQLQQVVLNLCLNSRDAMPAGGRITLRIESVRLDESQVAGRPGAAPGRWVLLSVGDTGIGMSRETLSRIFEPFFSTKDSGVGLGLSTVAGIVRQHGGFTDVDSEPGIGTTIRIYLPRLEREARRVAPQAVRSVVGGSETILVVEDQPALRRMVAKALTLLGYRALEAKDGVEALEVLRKVGAAIDLVLTDAIMPHMGGKEMFDLARQLYPRIAFLFTSANPDPKLREDLSVLEHVGWIEKPFDLDGLAAKVRRILDEAGT